MDGHFLHVYTYHTRENGVIGKEYNNENILQLTQRIGDKFSNLPSTGKVVTSNLTVNRFFMFIAGGDSITYYIGRIYNNFIQTSEKYYTDRSSFSTSVNTLIMSQDDNYIYPSQPSYYENAIIKINPESNYETVFSKINATNLYIYEPQRKFFLTINNDSSEPCVEVLSYDSSGNKQTLKSIAIEDIIRSGIYSLNNIYFNGNILLIFYYTSYPSRLEVKKYSLNIEDVPSGSGITADETLSLNLSTDATSRFFSRFDILYDESLQKIFFSTRDETSSFREIDLSIDTNNIIGVKYKNKVFYNTSSNQLTASQQDVAEGKTFIGYNGIPETGTMEVE